MHTTIQRFQVKMVMTLMLIPMLTLLKVTQKLLKNVRTM